MSDLDDFKRLLKKAGADYDVSNKSFSNTNGSLFTKSATKIVHVDWGSRCHFEAEFDDDDNIVSIGQWEEL